MFKSEPICVLTAGPTVDGRNIPQKVIDDIAETYNPKTYTARLNEDHSFWSWKGGSVLSVEARGSELWAVIKPNSHLLRNVENDQLLHTSCEYVEDFAGTGKAYLTGLAFTDSPASLGTTQVHLSANQSDEKKVLVCTGNTLSVEQLSTQSGDDSTLLHKIFNLLTANKNAQIEQLSNQEESEQMSKETEELLKQSIEQNKELNTQLGALVTQLSKQNTLREESANEPEQPEPNTEVAELKDQVSNLSTGLNELTEKFGKITDDEGRLLAGQGEDDTAYL